MPEPGAGSTELLESPAERELRDKLDLANEEIVRKDAEIKRLESLNKTEKEAKKPDDAPAAPAPADLDKSVPLQPPTPEAPGPVPASTEPTPIEIDPAQANINVAGVELAQQTESLENAIKTFASARVDTEKLLTGGRSETELQIQSGHSCLCIFLSVI